MKKLKLKQPIPRLFMLVIFLLGVLNAKAQTTDFSGNWKRNDEKTDAGGLSINSVPVQYEISPDARAIHIKRTSRNGKGEVSVFNEDLKFDGSVSETITPSKLKREVKLLWSPDHHSFVQTTTSRDEQGNIKQTFKYTWALSSDGKNLKIQANLETEGKTYQMNEVFDKQ